MTGVCVCGSVYEVLTGTFAVRSSYLTAAAPVSVYQTGHSVSMSTDSRHTHNASLRLNGRQMIRRQVQGRARHGGGDNIELKSLLTAEQY